MRVLLTILILALALSACGGENTAPVPTILPSPTTEDVATSTPTVVREATPTGEFYIDDILLPPIGNGVCTFQSGVMESRPASGTGLFIPREPVYVDFLGQQMRVEYAQIIACVDSRSGLTLELLEAYLRGAWQVFEDSLGSGKGVIEAQEYSRKFIMVTLESGGHLTGAGLAGVVNDKGENVSVAFFIKLKGLKPDV